MKTPEYPRPRTQPNTMPPQRTPIIPHTAIRQAQVSSGVYVVVTGQFLIDHNIAEQWYDWRGISRWPSGTKGIEGGRITPDFSDRLLLTQAAAFGLFNQPLKGADHAYID